MTPVHVADGLSWLICVGIIFVGLRFLFEPRESAAGYGVAVESDAPNATAYLAVKAVRDLGAGLIILALITAGAPHDLGWYMLAASIIPIGDAAIVLRNQGSKVLALAMHGGTAVVMLVAAGLLLS